MSSFVQHKKSFLAKPASIFVGIFISLFIGGALLYEAHAAGAVYYVDGVNGNDNNNGTSLGSAWKTIAKANATHTSGDIVNILPAVYRESLVPKTGTAQSPTKYQGLGDRNQILILGSDQVTGWQLYSSSNGNIYRAPFQAPQQCRYNGSTYTVNNTNCWINRNTWLLRADPNVQTDSLGALNAPGEYYYDQASQFVYVRMPDDSNPSNSLIECSKREVLRMGEYSPYPPLYNFVLDNVTIMQTNGRGVTMSPYAGGAGNVTIQNSQIAYTGGESYCVSNPAAIYNGSATGGAYLPDTPSFNILNNVIHDAGSDRGPSVGDWRIEAAHLGAGVEWYGVRDSRIEGNEFYNIAQPIALKRGDVRITVKNNTIHDSREGVWLGWPTATGQFAATIEGNLFYNLISRSDEKASGVAIFNGCGDNRYNVYNNTLVNTSGLHNTTENDQQGGCNLNNVFMTAKNNVISNLAHVYAGASGTRFLSFYWNSMPNVVSNRNQYYHPSTPTAFAYSTPGRKALSITYYPTLQAWRNASGEDANSIQSNPLFANAGANNYQLQAGSPGIDQGEFISGFHCAQSDDVNPNQTGCRHWKGVAPDIGAFEYGITYTTIEGVSATPPETIITQAPGAIVSTQKTTISFSGNDSDSATASLHYSYKLDSGPWSSWSGKTSVVFSKLTNGGHIFNVRSRDPSGNIDASAASAQFTVAYTPDIVMGNEAGASPAVYIVSKAGKITKHFFAFEKTFRGGVQVALGDFFGDGHNEIIVGSGAGRRGEVAIFTKEGRRLGVLAPFGSRYRDGVSVTAADIDDDGIDEIVMSRMKGKPEMLVYRFNGTRFTNTKVKTLAYSAGVSGLSLASGDMDGDGTDEVVAVPALSGDPIVRVFKFSGNKLYLWKVAPRAFKENITGGFTIATGNVRHDWRPDIVVIPKSSRPTKAQVLTMNASMKLTVSLRYYYPFGTQDANGGRIAIADIDGDRTEDIITTKGQKVRQAVLVLNGNTTKRIRTFRLFSGNSRLVLSLTSGVL